MSGENQTPLIDGREKWKKLNRPPENVQKVTPELAKSAVSVQTMREADQATIARGTPSRELMRRAAQGVFDAYGDWKGKSVLILCGGGNNGGDGYALAEILHDHGERVVIYRAGDALSEDGAYYFQRCAEKEIPVLSEPNFPGCDVYVDCLLGTGFRGEPREPIAGVIRELNSARNRYENKFVISVDINSGMNGDTGEGDAAVISDLTVSIGFLKKGLLQPQARERIGSLVNVDIGISLS